MEAWRSQQALRTVGPALSCISPGKRGIGGWEERGDYSYRTHQHKTEGSSLSRNEIQTLYYSLVGNSHRAVYKVPSPKSDAVSPLPHGLATFLEFLHPELSVLPQGTQDLISHGRGGFRVHGQGSINTPRKYKCEIPSPGQLTWGIK